MQIEKRIRRLEEKTLCATQNTGAPIILVSPGESVEKAKDKYRNEHNFKGDDFTVFKFVEPTRQGDAHDAE